MDGANPAGRKQLAGAPEDLINWSASRRRRIEDALEALTDQYVRTTATCPATAVAGQVAGAGSGR
ncbi:hypothetical protein EAO73_13805 [Streptomyces sp. col6]|uniref:hypothetical protein n=1 Tax=Streptomyces sp. col6 TaxID=2478958 RepID=UPI0011CDC3BA|nr:hypothetical protein [Streptomyces sp. col6]TXS04806.1 hypothetical protein EAO73_13805 [Streptomyces sp. col6]